MEKKLNYACRVCGGAIIERSEIPFLPTNSETDPGFGVGNKASEADRRVTGYHCDICGIEYHQLPK